MGAFSEEVAMVQACPVPTPEQRKAGDILIDARQAMLDKVHAAVIEATERVREQTLAGGLDVQPPPKEYFQSVVHQQMYLSLCGADPDSFEGGNARKAIGIIRNQQLIAKTYWGADIEVLPRPGD